MFQDDDRPGWLASAASYAPLAAGATIAGKRFLSSHREFSGSISGAIRSNAAANVDARNIGSLSIQGRSRFKQQQRDLFSLRTQSEHSFDPNMGITSVQGSQFLNRADPQKLKYALYKLAHDRNSGVNISNQDIERLMASGNVQDELKGILGTSPERTKMFMQHYGSGNGVSLGSSHILSKPFSATSGFSSVSANRVKLGGIELLTGGQRKFFEKLTSEFGDILPIDRNNPIRVSQITPGGAVKGTATQVALPFRQGSKTKYVDFLLQSDTHIEVGGKRHPLYLFFGSGDKSTTYALSPRIKGLSPDSLSLNDPSEEWFGRVGKRTYGDAPIVHKLREIKSTMVAGQYGASGRAAVAKLLEQGAYGQFTSEAMDQGVHLASLSGHDLTRAYITSNTAFTDVYDAIGKGAISSASEAYSILAKGVENKLIPGLGVSSPRQLAAGKVYIGPSTSSIPFSDPTQRELRPWGGEWQIASDVVEASKTSRTVGAIGPGGMFNRFEQPFKGELGQISNELGDVARMQWTGFALTDKAEEALRLHAPEGTMLSRVGLSRQHRDLLQARWQQGFEHEFGVIRSQFTKAHTKEPTARQVARMKRKAAQIVKGKFSNVRAEFMAQHSGDLVKSSDVAYTYSFSKHIDRAVSGEVNAFEGIIPKLAQELESRFGANALEELSSRGGVLPFDFSVGGKDVLGLRTAAAGVESIIPGGKTGAQYKIKRILATTGYAGKPEWQLDLEARQADTAAKIGKFVEKPTLRQDLAQVERSMGGIASSATEALITGKDIKRLEPILRTQQLGALTFWLHNNRKRTNITANTLEELASFISSKGETTILGANNEAKYLERPGTKFFIGALSLMKELRGSSWSGLNPETMSIFAAEAHTTWGKENLGLAHRLGLLDQSVEDTLSAWKKQDVVYGLSTHRATKMLGWQSGDIASIDLRGVQAMAANLDPKLAGALIGDIMSRNPEGLERLKLAADWTGSEKGWMASAESVDISTSGGAKSFSGLTNERSVVSLPSWLEAPGNRLLVPSKQDLASLDEPRIRYSSGEYSSGYRTEVDELLRQVKDIQTTDKGLIDPRIGEAKLAYKNVLAEQATLTNQAYQQALGKKVPLPGSVNVDLWSLGEERAKELSSKYQQYQGNAIGMTEAAFERAFPKSHIDPEYYKELSGQFHRGEAVPLLGISDAPNITYGSFRPAMGFKVDHGQAGRDIAAVFSAEARTKVLDASGKETMLNLSLGSSLGTTVDFDGDLQAIVGVMNKTTGTSIKEFLSGESGQKFFQRQTQQSAINRYINEQWKQSVKGDVGIDDVAHLRTSTNVGALMQRTHAGLVALEHTKQIGLLSNAMSSVRQVTDLMPNTRTGDMLSPRETMNSLLSSIEESAISSKHAAGSQSLAQTISHDIGKFMSAGAGEVNSMGRTSTAGEFLANRLLGTVSPEGNISGGILEEMNMGFARNVDLKAEVFGRAQMQVTPELHKQFSEQINQFLSNEKGKEHFKLGQQKAQMIREASSPVELERLLKGFTEGGQASTMEALSGAAEILGRNSNQVTEGALGSVNTAMKTLGGGRWQHISKPLMFGAMLTGIMYNTLAGPGYSKEPLTMPNETVDPRILEAIRSGQLLAGASSEGGQSTASPQAQGPNSTYSPENNIGEQANQYSGYNGNVYSPTARISYGNSNSYQFKMNVGSEAEASRISQQLSANIPHTRVGYVTSHSVNRNLRKQEDYL